MTDSISGTSSSSSSSSSQSLLQFNGVSSGLDTAALINALLQNETNRVTSLQNQVKTLQTRRTAYTTLQSSLTAFLGKLQAFTMLKAGSSRSATSADTSKFTAVANSAAVTGQYSIAVDRLATSTVATSTGSVGTPITSTAANLADLPFAGSVKNGTLTMTVDGQVVTATIGNPATTTLQSAMDAIAAAIQGKLGGDGTATVTLAGNRLQVGITGNTASHSLLLGASADTSNLFGLTGLSGQSATVAGGGGSITGQNAAGVVRTTVALDTAGLTGLTSTKTGKITINGVDIAYDTTADSLTTVLSRINNSQAGVTASIDRMNDRIILTSKTTGASPIVMVDSGSLLAALHLEPGTTNAQTIGQNALVHVDGRAVTSASNQVTNAIDNVTLNLVAETATPAKLTVGVDQSRIEGAVKDLVDGYNTLADTLDKMTQNGYGQTPGDLATDYSARNLLLTIRGSLFKAMSGATGSVKSLMDVGVSTGKVGATVGSTSRLVLDTDKLHAALANDPGGVAQLLSSTGALQEPVATLKSWTDYGGVITGRTKSIDDQTRTLNLESVDAVERLDTRRAALEAKYAKMESTLSQLQQTLASLTSQTNALNK